MHTTPNPTAAPTLPAVRATARERLLEAAGTLFYEEGINTVGIDRVIERAGVAKASLYNCFGSKEALVHAYLDARRTVRQQRLTMELARLRTPRARLLGVFDVVAALLVESEFRGCAFLKANAETRADSPSRTVCQDMRAWTIALFEQLAGDAGARRPAALAKQLMVLYDGATVAAQMDRDASAAAMARTMAAALLDAATAPAGR